MSEHEHTGPDLRFDSYGIWCERCPARWTRVGGRLDNLIEQHNSELADVELERQKAVAERDAALARATVLREALQQAMVRLVDATVDVRHSDPLHAKELDAFIQGKATPPAVDPIIALDQTETAAKEFQERVRAEVRREVLEEVARAAESGPVPSADNAPHDAADIISRNPLDAIQAAVTVTKRRIAEAIRAMKDQKP